MKNETQPTALELEETFAHSFGVLGAQLVAIRQQAEKRYKKSPAYKQDRKAARAGNKLLYRRVPYTDEETAALKAIEDRAKKLRQIESILNADPELIKLTGAGIENQVKAVKRRQTRMLVAVSIVSLIVGWLLSAISPATALTQLVARSAGMPYLAEQALYSLPSTVRVDSDQRPENRLLRTWSCCSYPDPLLCWCPCRTRVPGCCVVLVRATRGFSA